MQAKVNKAENNTYKIDLTVEASKVDAAIENALKHEAENAEIKGFRKGKAPLNKVKESLDQSKLRNHALNHLLEEVIPQVITENKLNPIVYPRFELKEFEEGKDLTAIVTVIEKPEIKLGDYKKAVKKVVETHKNDKDNKDQPISSDLVIDALLSVSTVGVAKELTEDETNRMLSSLVDQVKNMGVTLEQYLESINKKPEDLRNEYLKIAERNIQSDFILSEIATVEKVTVSDAEIDQTVAAIPDPKSKEALSNPNQRMYIKAVILKNKTIQKIVDDASPKDSKSEKKESGASKLDKK